MSLLAVLVTGLWFADNAEFVSTAEKQRSEGFRWHQIECRDVNPELPAITIDTPTGRRIVCHKLK
tara:strand:- start:234 stop:428 length:195 start_codon:yes stop_codon:yes gene_type:complete